MTLSAQATQPHQNVAREEGYLHYLAREGRTALRVCIGLCIIGIVATMVSPIWFVAFIPAAVMFVCVILLVVANTIERRSDTQAHAVLEQSETAIEEDVVEDQAEAHQFAPQTAAVMKREGLWGVLILGFVLLAALFVAFWFIPMKLFAIGALVVFAYMLLLAAPVLLGAFNDDIEDTTSTQQNDPSRPERAIDG